MIKRVGDVAILTWFKNTQPLFVFLLSYKCTSYRGVVRGVVYPNLLNASIQNVASSSAVILMSASVLDSSLSPKSGIIFISVRGVSMIVPRISKDSPLALGFGASSRFFGCRFFLSRINSFRCSSKRSLRALFTKALSLSQSFDSKPICTDHFCECVCCKFWRKFSIVISLEVSMLAVFNGSATAGSIVFRNSANCV
jgi:hypothetical protein